MKFKVGKLPKLGNRARVVLAVECFAIFFAPFAFNWTCYLSGRFLWNEWLTSFLYLCVMALVIATLCTTILVRNLVPKHQVLIKVTLCFAIFFGGPVWFLIMDKEGHATLSGFADRIRALTQPEAIQAWAAETIQKREREFPTKDLYLWRDWMAPTIPSTNLPPSLRQALGEDAHVALCVPGERGPHISVESRYGRLLLGETNMSHLPIIPNWNIQIRPGVYLERRR